jgi:uncharacterized protein
VLIKYLLSLYRKLTVYRFSACRYYPSCSHYAEEAIDTHGLFYGVFLALKRLIKCSQYYPGGYDPVPEVK